MTEDFIVVQLKHYERIVSISESEFACRNQRITSVIESSEDDDDYDKKKRKIKEISNNDDNNKALSDKNKITETENQVNKRINKKPIKLSEIKQYLYKEVGWQ